MPQDPYGISASRRRELLDQFAQGMLELEKGGTNAALLQRLCAWPIPSKAPLASSSNRRSPIGRTRSKTR